MMYIINQVGEYMEGYLKRAKMVYCPLCRDRIRYDGLLTAEVDDTVVMEVGVKYHCKPCNVDFLMSDAKCICTNKEMVHDTVGTVKINLGNINEQ